MKKKQGRWSVTTGNLMIAEIAGSAEEEG
jgi:hypothetical protein